MQELQNHIQEHLSALLMDPSSIVKRAILHDISSLCIFLGRQKTNDVLLSHMITYLNDRDWLLRYAFFESIVDVAACAGGRSLEEYILPLMAQALSGMSISYTHSTRPNDCYRCGGVRGSKGVIGADQPLRTGPIPEDAHLGAHERHTGIPLPPQHLDTTRRCRLHHLRWAAPPTQRYMVHPLPIFAALPQIGCGKCQRAEPTCRHEASCTCSALSICSMFFTHVVSDQLPRQILDAAVQWAMKAEKSAFWKGPRRAPTKVESPRESVISMRKTGNSGITRNRSEECVLPFFLVQCVLVLNQSVRDETHLTKLQQLGMTPSDETKLLALRDYTLKLANATSSFASRLINEPDTGQSLKVVGDVELQKLGVVPQTVFLKSRNSDGGGRYSRIPSVSSRRTNSVLSRTPIVSPSRLNTLSSEHGSTGAPFEDLRRRLATINASASSLSVPTTPREARNAVSPVTNSSTTSLLPAGPSAGPPIDRPPSPSESIASTTNSMALGPPSRLHIGSTDGQKAAPAVGSSKTNATGLLEAHFKMRREGSPDGSGRTSPMSMSATVRGPRGLRNPSLLAISTYGMFLFTYS